VDTNGIHGTLFHTCHCALSPDDKWTQLFKAGLFPATADDPRTAFTFRVLEHYDTHALKSKQSAVDYFESLRLLSDGAFFRDIPVSFP
jgi:hypothetical protein